MYYGLSSGSVIAIYLGIISQSQIVAEEIHHIFGGPIVMCLQYRNNKNFVEDKL